MATNKNNEKEMAGTQTASKTETNTAQKTSVDTTESAAMSEKEDKKTVANKNEKKPKPMANVLAKAGHAAIARHGFKEAFVTSDGQVFPQFSDAKNHASNLINKEIIKVTK